MKQRLPSNPFHIVKMLSFTISAVNCKKDVPFYDKRRRLYVLSAAEFPQITFVVAFLNKIRKIQLNCKNISNNRFRRERQKMTMKLWYNLVFGYHLALSFIWFHPVFFPHFPTPAQKLISLKLPKMVWAKESSSDKYPAHESVVPIDFPFLTPLPHRCQPALNKAHLVSHLQTTMLICVKSIDRIRAMFLDLIFLPQRVWLCKAHLWLPLCF